MQTKIIRGLPEDLKIKKMLRINEAKNFKRNNTITHNVIDNVNGLEVFFDTPGKDMNKFYYDMAPGVGEQFYRYSFKDIWNDMFNICINICEDSYKKLLVILYRMAYLIDFEVKNEKVRFNPPAEIKNEIAIIQEEIDKQNKKYNVLELLYFIDLLAWNEDVRYYQDNNKKPGRINCIYGIITVVSICKDFYDSVLNHSKNTSVDINSFLELTQQFIHGRGMISCSDKDLLKILSPYLYN